MLVYACFHVISPFSAHFYPPLHHNGKGSIGEYTPTTQTNIITRDIAIPMSVSHRSPHLEFFSNKSL